MHLIQELALGNYRRVGGLSQDWLWMFSKKCLIMPQYQQIVQAHLPSCVWLMLIAVLCGGCSGRGGLERAVMFGTVTYNGKPIAAGRIKFVPDVRSQVPSITANIANGEYKADLHGGVPVGTFKIEIEAYANTPATPQPMWIPENCLPKRFNANSSIRITIEPGSREIRKDFALTD